jgi:hypothetical protein
LGWKNTQDREQSCKLIIFVRTQEYFGIQTELKSSRNINEKCYKEKEFVAIVVASLMLWIVGQPYIVHEIVMKMHL